MTNRFSLIKNIGKAIGRVNGNNTHSGNISIRDQQDKDLFYITASGSQIGNLIPKDMVPLKFSGVSWGDARASTESNIHRKILQIPEAMVVVHSHFLNSTYISFDTKEKQLFLRYTGKDKMGREEFLFQPVDHTGSNLVGDVVVAHYDQPVGSVEMEKRIPKYLENKKMTIIRGHGAFTRGKTLEEALSLLSNLEHSSKLIISLRRRGIDTVWLSKKIGDKPAAITPRTINFDKPFICEIRDLETKKDFEYWLNFNYNYSLCGYGSGSMSQKITANKMIFCPMGAVPENMDFPLYYLDLGPDNNDPCDIMIHKLIYQNTTFNTCMITANPLTVAEAMAELSEKYGVNALYDKSVDIPYRKSDHPVIKPIDAEAIYLNPRLGVIDIHSLTNPTAENPLLNMLRSYKGCCAVANYGVISCGDTTLEQAAHNASSAERISMFRSQVFINEKILNGPRVKGFEISAQI